MLPLAAVLEIVLILCGQGADGTVQAFTQTADWTFSQQLPPPPLEYQGHYLCTVAAGGHRKLVRPLRLGYRRGAVIVVNRQLAVANAFEELLQERLPRLHRLVRHFYNNHGYPLSQKITTPFRADLVYLLMKPLEWLFAAVLYLFDLAPECRIARQYTVQKKIKAISHKERLATLHAICLQISRHISQNAREYIKYSLRFLFHLTKNLTTHLSHNLLCGIALNTG